MGPVTAARVANGTAGAVYQRRAQFRMALASYQGRTTRPVPSAVVDSVRNHIESSAYHLINSAHTSPLERYARVTRVHVMCILRNTGGGKYSKWYRESHYFHYVITKQPPPDLNDSENILVLMFDMGRFHPADDFFLSLCLMIQKNPMVYTPEKVNGNKIWMVATECVMTLFALLYAFPHIPSCLLDDVYKDETEEAEDPQWYSVTSTAAMRAAMESILKTSEVLETSLTPGRTVDGITKDAVSSVGTLSSLFDLRVDDPDVPSTCRQMLQNIVAVYAALNQTEITTREELFALYKRYQLISSNYQLAGLSRVAAGDQSSLVRFCTELMVQWMQPYFSKHPRFYMPNSTSAVACR